MLVVLLQVMEHAGKMNVYIYKNYTLRTHTTHAHTHTHIVIKACFCMPNQFYLAMKFCFISLNMLTLRTTAVVNRKSYVNT